MDFRGNGRPLSDGGIDKICDILGVSEPEIWAVLNVETRGFGFLKDRRPQILFERHIFRRLTNGKYDAGSPDISNKNPGGYVGGSGEYTRLERAMALDPENALKSASWGIGQVMGFNHTVAGYPTVYKMVEDSVREEDSQILAMANFIKGSNLSGSLQRRNWTSFARGYNGRDFKKNEYDTRLAAAHGKYQVTLPDLSLRSAQAALYYLGIEPGPIDGFRGRLTRSALVQFQQSRHLPVSGEFDEETETKLLSEAFPA
jgi:hypothetical protein